MDRWDDEYVDIRLLYKPNHTVKVRVKLESLDGKALQTYVMEDIEVIGDADPVIFEGGKKYPLLILSGRCIPENE